MLPTFSRGPQGAIVFHLSHGFRGFVLPVCSWLSKDHYALDLQSLQKVIAPCRKAGVGLVSCVSKMFQIGRTCSTTLTGIKVFQVF